VEPPRRIPLKVYGTSGWDPDAFLLTGLNLQFDQVRLANHAVVVLNLDAPSALLGFELGGIVGHKFLSRYEVGIDLQRSCFGSGRCSGHRVPENRARSRSLRVSVVASFSASQAVSSCSTAC